MNIFTPQILITAVVFMALQFCAEYSGCSLLLEFVKKNTVYNNEIKSKMDFLSGFL